MSFIWIHSYNELLQAANDWQPFIVCYCAMLLVTLIMTWQSTNFYTHDVVTRRFGVMELELPATPTELVNTLAGIFELPTPQKRKTYSALKAQLVVDFLFMPLAYGSIALLCWRVSHKMTSYFGQQVFAWFAILQLLPWLCDIIENVYLLVKLRNIKAIYRRHGNTPEQIKQEAEAIKQERKEIETSATGHKLYLGMEAIKWGLSLTATVCAAGAVAYFWVTRGYSSKSLCYVGWYVGVTVVFVLIAGVVKRKGRAAAP